MRPDLAWLTLFAAGVFACGGAQRGRLTPGCVAFDHAPDTLELTPDHPVNVPQQCPGDGVAFIATPVRFSATADGLQIQFDVTDPSFVPGTLRLSRGQRDVVVVFPNGESPGRPTIELAAIRIAGGYRVDDVVPWETWHLRGPEGEFRFVCALFDREASGAENEIRIAMHVRVRSAPR